MLEAQCLWIWVPLAHPALDLAFPVEGAAVSWSKRWWQQSPAQARGALQG